MHDKEELKPRYILCDNGEKMWNEKKQCYPSSRDFDEAQKMLRDQRTRYIEYLVANEKVKRCQKVKTKKVMKLYSSPEQTAKLIDLGFEKPKGRSIKREWLRF